MPIETIDTDAFNKTGDYSRLAVKAINRNFAGLAASSGVLTPENFGAIGNNIADDTDSLQAMLDTVAFYGGVIQFPSGLDRVYRISRELSLVTTKVVTIRAAGAGSINTSTAIRSSAAMRSVLRILAGYLTMEGITLDGNNLADYGQYGDTTALSVFNSCKYMGAKFDGVFNPALRTIGGATNNDTVHWQNCWFTDNGRLYVSPSLDAGYATIITASRRIAATGTVSVGAGGAVITGVGTNFGSIPMRSGDIIRIDVDGVNSQYLMISSVNAATQEITIHAQRTSPVTLNNRPYAISVGSGYKEETHSDNNTAYVESCFARGNAGAGFCFSGIYGPTVVGGQADVNGVCGITVGSGNSCFDATIMGVYMEGHPAASFILQNAPGVLLAGNRGLATTLFGVAGHTYGTNKTTLGEKLIGPTSGNGYTSNVPTTAGFNLSNVGRFTDGDPNQATQVLVAGTMVSSANSLNKISAAAPISLTAVPTIQIPPTFEFQTLTIFNIGAQTITFQGSGVLPGSQLRLVAGTVALPANGTLKIAYIHSMAAWVQQTPVLTVI